MSIIVQVSQLGPACLPSKYASGMPTGPIRLFTPDKDALNQTRRFLRNGGSIVLHGDWPEVSRLAEQIASRAHDLIPRVNDARARKQAMRQLSQRMLTTIDNLTKVKLLPEELAGLLGESEFPPLPVLIPVDEASRLTANDEPVYHVPSLGVDLLTHPDVLTPRSGETIELMRSAIDLVATQIPMKIRVLDMGCGTGVLTIATAMRLAEKQATITASDILPEALALTRLNVQRLHAQGQIPSCAIETSVGGDLFDPLWGQQFDLIIFNAPWVAAPAHNRAELALNDRSQSTIQRFLQDCPRHLLPGGRVIVGYADNSGHKAIARLERFIEAAGLSVIDVLRDRIKTYRSKRPWQTVYAYILEVAPK